MTTASAHLSKDLKELIKSIGETKSKQEEDRIILAELALLKPRLSEKNLSPKQTKEHLIRAMYIEMLGHSAPFAHIHAINLTQNKNLILKRIGYLMCSLFFDSSSDLLIMLVATIIKDLTNGDVHEIVICLTSLGHILNSTIASAVTDHVVKLVTHTTDLVRKKAVLLLQKIKAVTGAEVPEYREKMKKALCDREPSVMAASLNLYLEEVRENPRKYRDLAGSFVIILKQVIEHKLPKEFDYHRMPAPWIELKLLKILEVLGKGDLKASEHCYTILEQVLRRAEETNNNISIAVAYQCVRTIAAIYPNEALLRESAGVLGKLLEPRSSNNMKYLGVQVLGLLHRGNAALLEEHQLTIVECLESKDETLKGETLELLFRMASQDNVEVIVSKMLNSLHGSTDNHFRSDLVLKITDLAERFSTTHKWYLDTMQILFELGSEYLSEDILNNFLRLVMENYNSHLNFGEEIVLKMIELIEKVVPTDFVLKAATWVIGEVGADYYRDSPDKLEQLARIVLRCLDYDYEQQSSKKWVLDALVKLSSAPAFRNHADVKLVLDRFSRHADIELYQRALGTHPLTQNRSASPSTTPPSRSRWSCPPSSRKDCPSSAPSCRAPSCRAPRSTAR